MRTALPPVLNAVLTTSSNFVFPPMDGNGAGSICSMTEYTAILNVRCPASVYHEAGPSIQCFWAGTRVKASHLRTPHQTGAGPTPAERRSKRASLVRPLDSLCKLPSRCPPSARCKAWTTPPQRSRLAAWRGSQQYRTEPKRQKIEARGVSFFKDTYIAWATQRLTT